MEVLKSFFKSLSSVSSVFLLSIVAVLPVFSEDSSMSSDSVSERKLQKVRDEFRGGNIGTDTLDVSGIGDSGGSESSPSLLSLTVRIVISLILIILVLYLLMFLLKKGSKAGGSDTGSGGSMDLIESIYTGPGSSVVLVRILDSVYVLGQTSKGISFIDKIEGEKAVEAIAMTKSGPDITGFKEVFSNFMNKVKNSGSGHV
ncbi:MAG: flagellar biosynthetic protein FliO [Chitinivibrionales bacterium]